MGIRNHVIILFVDDISNACPVEKVAAMMRGDFAAAALAMGGCGCYFGEDLDLRFRTMIGTGTNANVAAVVPSIGIGGRAGLQKIVDGIKKTGKPVMGFSIEGRGDLQTAAMRGARLEDASGRERVAARALRFQGIVYLREVRRIGYHDWIVELSDRWQRAG